MIDAQMIGIISIFIAGIGIVFVKRESLVPLSLATMMSTIILFVI